MATATPGKYKVIGQSPVRHDGVDKVTGRAVYGADISLPGMLYGKVLRSPHAHARIRSIDTSRAEAHPDVRAVATATDLADTPTASPIAVLGQMPSANIAPPLAALANAIYDAAGIRMRSLPMNPAAVVKALEELED